MQSVLEIDSGVNYYFIFNVFSVNASLQPMKYYNNQFVLTAIFGNIKHNYCKRTHSINYIITLKMQTIYHSHETRLNICKNITWWLRNTVNQWKAKQFSLNYISFFSTCVANRKCRCPSTCYVLYSNTAVSER